MLPIDVGWNDVGSWKSLWDIAPHDANGNYVHGDSVLEDTSGCYVHSERGLVATIGVKDLIIVDTPDALLVTDKSRSQDVTKIVARLKQSNRKEQEQHLKNYRPWGFFETLNIGPRFQVKLLHVNPGGKLSMQMHHHRSEHWIVVQGTAKVVIEDIEKLVRENESVYIVSTQWHRLENPGKVPLELIEVQIGTYLGEDDIIRADDVYRRTGRDEIEVGRSERTRRSERRSPTTWPAKSSDFATHRCARRSLRPTLRPSKCTPASSASGGSLASFSDSTASARVTPQSMPSAGSSHCMPRSCAGE